MWIFLLSIQLNLFLYIASQRQGNICTTLDDKVGKCILINECSGAIEAIRKGHFPKRCGFQGLVPIICCQSSTNTIPKPPPSSTTTRKPKTTTTEAFRINQTISAKMCAEYSTIENPVIPLLPSSTVDLQFRKNCDNKSPFIVGGEDAAKGEYPHMVAIGYNVDGEIQWNCGGSLISPDFVLTAAHCLKYGNNPTPSTVRLGELIFSNPTETRHLDIGVKTIIPHPKYKYPHHYNDIGLVQLAQPVSENELDIQPACLPQSNIPVAHAVATGWGRTEYGGEKSDKLQKVSLDIVSNKRCGQLFTNNIPTLQRGIVSEMICAGKELGKDTCQGDSGGPLQVFNSDVCNNEIIGVTSFGSYCGSGAAAVYTRVESYIPWLESIVWK